jgi:hypothetical protein
MRAAAELRGAERIIAAAVKLIAGQDDPEHRPEVVPVVVEVEVAVPRSMPAFW